MFDFITSKHWGACPRIQPELIASHLCSFDELMSSRSLGVPFKTKPSLEIYRVKLNDGKTLYLKRSLPRKTSVVLREMIGWIRRGKPAHTEAFHVYEAAQKLKELSIPVMNIVAWGEERFLGLWPHRGFMLAENVEGEEHASRETCQAWADELEAVWLETLGLTQADLTFDRVEAEALQNYFYAVELLLRCKDAAIRITKQAWAELEDRLLTYPS